MEAHEYANLFPMLPDAELQELANDIKAHGLQVPVTTYQGKILDGRNRWRACEIAGVEPTTAEYTGDDPLAFVVSGNLHRRHLSESQRGMVAARIADLPHGGAIYSEKNESSIELSSKTQREAAAMLNVGRETVKRARAVVTKGTAELAAAVDAGDITVSAAAEIAKLPAARQLEVLAEGPEAVKEKAKEIRDFGGEIAPSPKPDSEYVAPEAPPKLGKFTLDQTAHILPQILILIGKISPKDINFESALTEVITACQKRINTKK